jgi:two-component system sensor histidine kinase YesM
MRILFVYIIFLNSVTLFAQTNPPVSNTNTIVQKAQDVQQAYKKNDEYAIAKSYEQLGNEYFAKSDYKNAEENYSKAKLIYIKLKKKEDKNRVSRLLAKSQEAQNKIDLAIINYQDASDDKEIKSKQKVIVSKKLQQPASPKAETETRSLENTTVVRNDNSTNAVNINDKDINLNDAQRLKNNSNPTLQTNYIESNIKLLEKSSDEEPIAKEELANSYTQLADIQLQQNKIPQAIQNYSNALDASTTPATITTTGNQLSNAYVAAGKFDAAIQVQEKILAKKEIQQDANLKITQIQNLADIYTQKEDDGKALSLLKQSYDIALEHNNTIQAKNSIEQMVEIYQRKGNLTQSIALYKSFLSAFENIIENDSLLLDKKVLLITEDKIKQLEQEKALKDELIKKKSIFNYFLIGAALLLMLLVFFIAKSLYAIKIKNKKIELQSLRREMNPHFVFNSLNSINQFIAQNNELEANKYLSSYSNLMRSMMENSNKDFISLTVELELLKRYLDLEKLRFSDKFDYAISIDEQIDTDALQIPNMLIQPHLENAIWHGLRYKETKGMLQLSFLLHENLLIVKIEDNGIGLEKSKLLKTKNQQVHKSIGLSNTQNRITLLNELYHKNIVCKITELQEPNQGTVVKISFDI